MNKNDKTKSVSEQERERETKGSNKKFSISRMVKDIREKGRKSEITDVPERINGIFLSIKKIVDCEIHTHTKGLSTSSLDESIF